MATKRKSLQVLLTPEQYEALRTMAGHSMSQFAAQILIKACKLDGKAPERGKYERKDK